MGYNFGYYYGYGGRSRVLADILYKTATTTTAGLRYLTDLGKAPKENGALFSGQGVKPNGVDQVITIPINDTIGSFVKTVDGVQTITDDFGAITDLVISSNNTHQDYYLFTRNLTASEKSLAQNNAEDFMLMAKSDASCKFASTMAMDDLGWITNQVDSLEYQMSNFTTTAQATQLQAGTQPILLTYDESGKVITGKADALEFTNVNQYAMAENLSMSNIKQFEFVFKPSSALPINSYNKLFNLIDGSSNSVIRVERLEIGNTLFLTVNTQNTSHNIVIPLDEAKHILYEFDADLNTVSAYADGVKVGSTLTLTNPINTALSTLYIGNSSAKNRGILGSIPMIQINSQIVDPLTAYEKAVAKGYLDA